MKALLINGSPNEFGCTYTALCEVGKALRLRGVEYEMLYLGKKPVAGCIACMSCVRTGRCFVRDRVREVQARLGEFGAIVVGSPVHYAAPSGQIVSFMDRLFFSTRGKMAGKLGASVVSCRRGGASSAFEQLNKYFTISNMPVVSSQYWNQVHGTSPEEVAADEEGMQTMRTLGENIAWLLKSIEAGRAAGVPAPEYEPAARTNFIR